MKNYCKTIYVMSALILLSVLAGCTAPEPLSKPLPIEFDPFEIGIEILNEDTALLNEMNFVRQKPKQYAEEVIRPRLEQRKTQLQTDWNNNTDAAASFEDFLKKDQLFKDIQECHDVLQKQQPLNALLPETGLAKAARWLAGYQGETGEVGHTTTVEGYTAIDQQMAQYGTFTPPWKCGQNCAYGFSPAKEIIAAYMIDHKVPDRGHRKNILNKAFTHAGSTLIRVEKNKYKMISVTNFAASYRSKE